ncbi:MAG: riboflavin synthase [Myxococcota bacterium]
MFTGLVQATGTLVSATDVREGRRLTIELPLDDRDLALGASVAVNGVCLTVVEAGGGRASFDAAFETLNLTTLGSKAVGDRVNLEPSLRLGDALGGHLVSGHVDGVGSMRSLTLRGDAWEVWFDAPEDLRRYIAPKGSITIDGVSLTVNDVDVTGFMVGIIPHTLSVTTLGGLSVGDPINLEVDVLARYVARLLQFDGAAVAQKSRITKSLLEQAGFATGDDA